jgi:glutamate dehydrogenase/leucine dehydrogenase
MTQGSADTYITNRKGTDLEGDPRDIALPHALENVVSAAAASRLKVRRHNSTMRTECRQTSS